MNEESTPTQRKRTRYCANWVISTLSNANASAQMRCEDEMTPEQLWHKWEIEACQEPLTPRLKWQLEMDREMLEMERKKNPNTEHALYVKTIPATQEILNMLDAMLNERRLRKEGR